MKQIKIAVIGYGNRGRGYTQYCMKHPEEYEVVGICDINKQKLDSIEFKNIPTFNSIDEFISKNIKCDIVCVSTQDKDHVDNALQLLNAGYNLLLEKPISNKLQDCIDILECAHKNNAKVFVCHVLRYTPFYNTIKKELMNNEIGKIINIQTQENIGFWHMAHSYVRGPWRNLETSSPIILAKCCHDLDLVCWFMNENCETVNSQGSLSFFKHENKPVGGGEYCSTCPVKDSCNYDAMKIYPFHPWCNFYYMTDEPTLENIKKKLPGTKFDKCVFDQDNNVCDHQSVIMKFESGAVCTHTLSAFSQNVYRTIHIQGTLGEMWGTFDEYNDILEIRKFDGTNKSIDTKEFSYEKSAHGGGDAAMMHEVFRVLNGEESISITSIDQSVLSHKIAFHAEESRVKDGETVKVN